jgi:ribose transport system permease protein
MKTTLWMERSFRHAAWLLFLVVLVIFGIFAPKFLTVSNLLNIGTQAAPAGVVAIGMTFVLLTAGVDLSVGAIMFVAAAVAGKMALAGQPFWLVVGAMLLVGFVSGAINAALVTWMRVAAFIVTLAMLFVGRGFALWLTQTRAMNMPGEYLLIGSTRVAGVPLPFLLFGLGAIIAHAVLKYTPFGRQVYAVGHSRDTAAQAGIDVPKILAAVYVLSGMCAAVGGLLTLGQLGAVTPKFGENYEFKAIAAAVLGGTSLLGGRGAVLPGTVFGVLLIQAIENGLVLMNADPYLYPLVTSATIFLAVLINSGRTAFLRKRTRRQIRLEPAQIQ